MTPVDLDRYAVLRLDVDAGPAAIPTVPDKFRTAPLFGDEMPPRGPRRAGPAARVDPTGLRPQAVLCGTAAG
jgi:hypothetical protein